MALPPEYADCPHCGEKLKGLRLPLETSYEGRIHWVCFNDECSYFVEGWEWMQQQYEATASYRFRIIDPAGKPIPLPVWSATALRDLIIDEDEE